MSVRRPAPPTHSGPRHLGQDSNPRGFLTFGVWGGKRERLPALPVASSPGAPEAHSFSLSLSISLFRKLARSGAGRRHQPAPAPHAAQSRGGHAEILMLACGAGRGTREGTRVAAAVRRHAGVQPQRGEDLQSQLRQVAARGEALRGPPPGEAAAPLLGPACCVSLVRAGPWLGEARRLVTVPSGSWSGHCCPWPEAGRRVTGVNQLRWNFCHVP